MNIIAKVPFGSHLYGTSTPESDVDNRYVFLPTMQDCFLNRVNHSFAAKDEEDGHYFSLTEFLRLAAEGQSVAIEMLNAPHQPNPHIIWAKLRINVRKFYTKNMDSFIGFAKTMSGKYSARIDRLNETEAILRAIEAPFGPIGCFDNNECMAKEGLQNSWRLGAIWDLLPESLNAVKTTNERNSGGDKRIYQVCGREIQATVTCHHAYTVIKKIYDSYGERVRNAKNGNIDFKSLSHAFRAALQCKEIVETGNLIFPLKDADWLRDVKLGRIDFFTNSLDKRLDDLIAEVADKLEKSDLPEKVDQKWVDEIIVSAYRLEMQHLDMASRIQSPQLD